MEGEVAEIAKSIGLVLAASLALQPALGPAINSIVQAIEDTGWLAGERTNGVLALVIGMLLGLFTGWLAYTQTGGTEPIWIGIGAFAGLIGPGTGGVRSRLVLNGYEFQREMARRTRLRGASQDVAVEAGLVGVDRADETVSSEGFFKRTA